jgi:hypothetical protein
MGGESLIWTHADTALYRNDDEMVWARAMWLKGKL